jgi:hypothetical protein
MDRFKPAEFDLAISSEGNPAAVGLVQSYAGTRPMVLNNSTLGDAVLPRMLGKGRIGDC